MIAILFTAVCLQAFVQAAGGISAGGRMEVDTVYTAMFWNLENFFDTKDDPLTADDDYTAFGRFRWGRRRFESKRNRIAKTIISLKDVYGKFPAVVGMAEIENASVLWRLVNLTPLAKLGYKYVHRDSPDRRGIDVALLYRESEFKPLQTDFYEVILDSDPAFRTRLILKCMGVLGVDTVCFFVVHFPSKYGGAQESLPGREAAARVLLSAADSGHAVIAMGDFNEQRPALIPMLQPFEPVLPFNAKGSAEAEGTIKFKGEWETIDHFFYLGKMHLRSFIYSPSFLIEEDKTYLGVKPFRTFIGPKYNGGVSDHLPIVLMILD